MLGFELKFRDKILHLPLEAGLIVTRKSTDREEDMYIDVGLYDPFTNNIVNWLREKLQLGDSIEIVIKQIEETETSVPLDKYDFHDRIGITKDEADKKTLERFLILKKELEDEGLI
ncbi:MAG TPA: hypothetical protein GX717_08100 [Clostridiaceae bacterium]|jgi:hypothetical protein|nr:hypothetical protein [Clostridiaceae bacterium]